MSVPQGIVIGLLILTVLWPTSRRLMFNRKFGDWIVDSAGLIMHFLVLPALTLALIRVFSVIIPVPYQNALHIHPLVAFALNFIVIDYLWYWNHRVMHMKSKLWNLHAVHHSAQVIDAFATARNSIWSPLFFVYLWYNAIWLFLIDQPVWFILGGSIGVVFNVWGHSQFYPEPGSRIHRIISHIFITPIEHHWHHSAENPSCNFATTFSLWDRLHGTFYCPGYMPSAYGYDPGLSTARQLLFPVGPQV